MASVFKQQTPDLSSDKKITQQNSIEKIAKIAQDAKKKSIAPADSSTRTASIQKIASIKDEDNGALPSTESRQPPQNKQKTQQPLPIDKQKTQQPLPIDKQKTQQPLPIDKQKTQQPLPTEDEEEVPSTIVGEEVIVGEEEVPSTIVGEEEEMPSTIVGEEEEMPSTIVGEEEREEDMPYIEEFPESGIELRDLILSLQKEPVTRVVSSCDSIITMNERSVCKDRCVPILKKNVSEESRFLEQFTDQQLNIIGMDKNIPQVIINPRSIKIQLIVADPFKMPIDYSLSLDSFNVGELLYVAGNEKILVSKIPDGFNTRRVLVSLILYQRKRSDLIQNMLLTDDDLRTIVHVIEGQGEAPYSFVLSRYDLEEIVDTGKFPGCSQDFLLRWQRYETLRVLPPEFIESFSYQLRPSQIGNMSPNESYIISRLLDVPENPFEIIFAKNRTFTRDSIKTQYGILVPPTWDVLDYVALNGADYPTYIEYDKFFVEKLVSIPTNDCKIKYLKRFNDVQIFSELRNYVSYNSRKELVENVLKMMDENEEVYFYSLVPGFENVVFFGNFVSAQKLSQKDIIEKMDFLSVQPYSLEDRQFILKQTRQLQNLLLNLPGDVDFLTPSVTNAISRAITNLENTQSDAALAATLGAFRSYLDSFLQMEPYDIAVMRKILYQKYYYSLTRNSLFVSPFVKNNQEIFNLFIQNINNPNPYSIKNVEAQQIQQDNLFSSILLMNLLFGYIPH